MYNTFNSAMRKRFGCKVYKLALSGGMTCPTRDGTKGTRGCIFCSAKGSGDFAEPRCESITQQIENAKRAVEHKNAGGKYIAYFQDYTNTYASEEYLRGIFTEAINHPDIVALSIATRPDCLPYNIIKLLQELNTLKPVWVELGLQTIHPVTAEYIRRGYELETYDEAMRNLKAAGIETIVHVIIGLPNETKEMMKATVQYVADSSADGIKLQLLHVLEGTDLAEDYRAGKFRTLELDEYADIIAECVALLPDNMVVHRITGDGAKRDLIAPLWSADKKRVLNTLNRRLADI